jgi:dihydropteroate synthase
VILHPVDSVALPWRGGVVRSGPAPLVMGILNVTPDSFSDGGRYDAPARALEHARAMVLAGADVVDVGGESTRPGAAAVNTADELARVLPVIEALQPFDVPISVDTRKAEVAAAALDAGADWINDISALSEDPAMGPLVADRGCPVVLMHMRGTPRTMQLDVRYTDAVAEVLDYLLQRSAEARSHGVEGDRIVIDPGIGFGKSPQQNLQLLRAVPRFVDAGFPVLVGASRKSFLGACFAQEPGERRDGSVAAALAAAAGGAHVVRVHDVEPTRRALDVFCGIAAASLDGGRASTE